MNRIFRRYYAVDKLPDDLRAGLQERGDVLVEITSTAPRTTPNPLISELVGTFPPVHGPTEIMIEDIRAMRED